MRGAHACLFEAAHSAHAHGASMRRACSAAACDARICDAHAARILRHLRHAELGFCSRQMRRVPQSARGCAMRAAAESRGSRQAGDTSAKRRSVSSLQARARRRGAADARAAQDATRTVRSKRALWRGELPDNEARNICREMLAAEGARAGAAGGRMRPPRVAV